MHFSLLQALTAVRIVPVVVIHDAAKAEPLARALFDGGLKVIEITFRTAAAPEAIRRIAASLPEMILGAGTLLTPGQIQAAHSAGAHFGVAPGFDPAVVHAAQSAGFPFIPGIATASELSQAIAAGCTVAKFFPAQQAGGPGLLKALSAAFKHTGVRFMPTGGVSEASLSDWLALPEVAAVGGSWMVEANLIDASNWPEITARTRKAVQLARQ